MSGVCDDKATSFEHHDTTAMEMYASLWRLLFFWTAGSILKGNVSPILFCFLQSKCVTGGNQVIVWKTWHALILQLRLVHFSVLYFKARVLVFLFEMTTSCFKNLIVCSFTPSVAFSKMKQLRNLIVSRRYFHHRDFMKKSWKKICMQVVNTFTYIATCPIAFAAAWNPRVT